MGSIILFLIILSILILVHELGHFFMARKFGIKIEELGLGYPPRLWGKRKGETTYSVNWLPFGGFVKMLGEDSDEQVKDKSQLKRAFFKQKKRVRITVLMAGVIMNFLLGVVLFAAIYTKLGIPEEVDYLVITRVAEGSPAEAVGLKPEDKVVGMEGLVWPEKETVIKDFVEYVNQHRGEEIRLKLEDGQEIGVVPRLEAETPEGQGALGVGITNVDAVLYPYWQRPFRGVWVGLKEAMAWSKEIVVSLGGMFYGLFKGEVPKDVAGPVGIYEISKHVTREGFLATLQFVAILSVNLSILNLLPIPALDGGRLFFIVIESITRKRVKPEVEQVFHLIGIALIIGLMVLVTINDIRRLVG
jgi:regulator of sigma E protease